MFISFFFYVFIFHIDLFLFFMCFFHLPRGERLFIIIKLILLLRFVSTFSHFTCILLLRLFVFTFIKYKFKFNHLFMCSADPLLHSPIFTSPETLSLCQCRCLSRSSRFRSGFHCQTRCRFKSRLVSLSAPCFRQGLFV